VTRGGEVEGSEEGKGKREREGSKFLEAFVQ